MSKQLLIIALTLLGTTTVFSQANKSIFFEVGGNGIGLSANFDSRFTKSEKGFGYRIGIGFVPGIDGGDVISTSPFITIPVGLNYLAGKAPNYFEGGIGATYISGSIGILGSDKEKSSGIGFAPSIGYRYAKTGKGFQGRIFISPLIGTGGAAIWGGVSLGFKF
jgi:hypothetical protein